MKDGFVMPAKMMITWSAPGETHAFSKLRTVRLTFTPNHLTPSVISLLILTLISTDGSAKTAQTGSISMKTSKKESSLDANHAKLRIVMFASYIPTNAISVQMNSFLTTEATNVLHQLSSVTQSHLTMTIMGMFGFAPLVFRDISPLTTLVKNAH